MAPRHPLSGFLPLAALAAALAVFVIAEVNYPHLQPQSQLAIFAALGFVLCFGAIPAHPSLANKRWARATDILLALLLYGKSSLQLFIELLQASLEG